MTDVASRQHRNRSIRHAISTSLLSKVSTAVLQFVSLPMAARVLGREEFGIYATVSMAVLSVCILQMGAGPALARQISEANARSDRDAESRLFLNGAVLVAVLAGVGLLLAGLLITFVPLPILFGQKYAPWVDVMKPALWIGAILMSLEIVISNTDRVREGYMEASIVNAWGAGGNLVGAVIVAIGVQFQPSISFLLLAIFLPNLGARLLSTVFLVRKRPYLLSRGFRPEWATMKGLVGDGLSFSATSLGVYLVEIVLCGLIVGRLLGPGQVAIFQVLTSFTTSFTGLIVMVGTPFWAALVDARSRGDHEWMVTSARRYYGYLAGLVLIAGVGLIGLGPILVPWWYGPDFEVDRALFAGYTLFLLMVGWRQVHRSLSIGLGLLPSTVFPILAGLALGLSLGVWGLSHFGLAALFPGLAAGTLLFPGWKIPRLVWRELDRSIRGPVSAAS